MTEFASLPPVTSDGLEPAVTAVAKAVADRADELGDALEEAVIRKSGHWKVAAPVLPHDDVRDAMCAHRRVVSVLGQFLAERKRAVVAELGAIGLHVFRDGEWFASADDLDEVVLAGEDAVA